MLGIEVAESTVSGYMVRRRRPPSQGRKNFHLEETKKALICGERCDFSSIDHSHHQNVRLRFDSAQPGLSFEKLLFLIPIGYVQNAICCNSDIIATEFCDPALDHKKFETDGSRPTVTSARPNL